jgi:hypothetical protein
MCIEIFKKNFSMYYELLYTSEASWEMNQQELLELLVQARKKNQQLDVTGILLYHQKEFMQLIEGKKEDILQLWKTIRKDKRHFFAKVIYQGPVSERGFSEWSMAFQNIEGLDLSKLNGYSDFLMKGFTSEFVSERPSTARNLLTIIKNNFLTPSEP